MEHYVLDAKNAYECLALIQEMLSQSRALQRKGDTIGYTFEALLLPVSECLQQCGDIDVCLSPSQYQKCVTLTNDVTSFATAIVKRDLGVCLELEILSKNATNLIIFSRLEERVSGGAFTH